jgi:hypothetical protein
MSQRDKSSIVSIFGEINTVVARAMAAEGKVHLIEPDMIPPTALFNEADERASCAVVFTPKTEREFDERVRTLRA